MSSNSMLYALEHEIFRANTCMAKSYGWKAGAIQAQRLESSVVEPYGNIGSEDTIFCCGFESESAEKRWLHTDSSRR